MPNVYMKEPERVQTIAAGGIGASPAIPAERVDKIVKTPEATVAG